MSNHFSSCFPNLPVIPAALIVICFGHPLEAEDAVPELTRKIDALASDASMFELPEGTYLIGSTWLIRRPGITIRGAGVGKTLLRRSDAFTGIMVSMYGEGSTITGLTIDGNCASSGGKTVGLALHQVRQTAEMVEVRNFCSIGIAVYASHCRVSRCVIKGIGNPTVPSMGIWRDAGKEPTNAEITIDHNVISDNGINGIYCTGGKITIADNELFHNHCQTIPSGGGQIDIGSARTTNTNAVITGNTVMDGGGARTTGIELGGGTFYVAANTIRNHAVSATGIAAHAKSTMIGNIISNSGQNTAHPLRCGIIVGPGATGFKLIGNRVFDDQPVKTQTWGIQIKPGCDQFEVRNNDLRGNLYPKGLQNQSNAHNRIIAGNLPADANR